MARYIDAENIDYTETVVGRDEYAGYRTVAFKSDIDDIPPADVVPRAEVERLKDLNKYLMSELSKAREQIAFMKRAEELDKIPKW